jgi:hypothetical protein
MAKKHVIAIIITALRRLKVLQKVPLRNKAVFQRIHCFQFKAMIIVFNLKPHSL